MKKILPIIVFTTLITIIISAWIFSFAEMRRFAKTITVETSRNYIDAYDRKHFAVASWLGSNPYNPVAESVGARRLFKLPESSSFEIDGQTFTIDWFDYN